MNELMNSFENLEKEVEQMKLLQKIMQGLVQTFD
jgi:hypothetical protein